MMMDRNRKLELIQRSLGIRHKLKVHDSMKAPDTHEDLARMMLSRWELEDELKAIEELLGETRLVAVAAKKHAMINKPAESTLKADPLLKTGLKTDLKAEIKETPVERISERQREPRRRAAAALSAEKSGF